VYEGRFHRLAQVLGRRHLHDGIVDKYNIERSPKPDAAHIPFQMLAFRVERAAHG
jgi:hypothetical protein